MEIRQLLQFIAVAELRSFRRAAERLHMAQPPLSQAIRRLEHQLDVVLLKRTSRSVELTEAGKAFLLEARNVVAGVDAAASAAREAAKGRVGRVRIGFTTPWAYDVVLGAVTAFRRAFGGVTLSLREETSSTQVQSLLDGALDVGFVRLPYGHVIHDLVVLPLRQDTLCIALPRAHALTGHARLPLTRLQGETFVLPPPPSEDGIAEISLRNQISGLCAEAGFTPRVAQEARRMETIVRLVDAGLGVALVPTWTSARQWSRDVVYVKLQSRSPLSRLVLAAVWRGSSGTPAVAHFVATLDRFIQRNARVSARRNSASPAA
jgi:DNA-binding transcriptional LysR family regulator